MDVNERNAELPANKIVLQVELWQSQNYWPIKGWGSPMSGIPHYACVLLTANGCEAFPDELSPPPGWSWADRWVVDTSSRYGVCDSEGWFYAATFDRLHDNMRCGTASGTVNKTSIVRKRRWLRTILCTSLDLYTRIKERIDVIAEMRTNIELSMKNREQAFRGVKFYEENRSFVFAQSLQLATQGTLNTLAVLKELGNKLKLFKMYLQERVSVERDFSKRMESLGLKYWSQFSSNTDNNDNNNQRILDASYILSSPSRTQRQRQEEDSLLSMQASEEQRSVLHCADVFFSKVFLAAQSNAQSVGEFSSAVLQIVSEEVDAMLGELQQILKESRAVFRKNSDICRLSEAAIRNFLSCVHIAYESSVQASLKEIALLSEESSGLKGGTPYHPAYFANVRPAHTHSQPHTQAHTHSAADTQSVIDFSGDDAQTTVSDFSHTSTDSDAQTHTSSTQPHTPTPTRTRTHTPRIAAGEPVTIAALQVKATPFASLTLFPSHNTQNTSFLSSASNNAHSNTTTAQGFPSVASTSKAIVQSILSAPREDLWLNVQRYKTSVRDSQEALCVLIAESMDLELQRQIIANRVHHLFTSCIKQYAKQELTLLSELHACWTQLMRDCLITIRETGLPYPALQSPFAKLNPILDRAASEKRERGSEPTDAENSADDSLLLDEEFMNNVGIFSFTKLFKEPLPECPGVVRSEEVLCAPISDFLRAKDCLSDDIWKPVYLIATADDYLHVIQNKKSDIPDRSFYLKQCVLNENMRDSSLRYQDVWKVVFEVSYSHIVLQQKNKHIYAEGLVFRPSNESSHAEWLRVLLSLTSAAVHTDTLVEQAAQQAMLEALPILRGETEKMDLELRKYQDLSLAQTPTDNNNNSSENNNNENNNENTSSAGGAQASSHVKGEREEDSEDEGDERGERDSDTSSDYESVSVFVDREGERETDDGETVTQTTSTSDEKREKESDASSSSLSASLNTPTQDRESKPVRASPFTAGTVKSRAAAFASPSSSSALNTNANTPLSSSNTPISLSHSWKKKDVSAVGTSVTPLRTAQVVGLVPVAEIKPKQIIPVVDTKVPLAKRHSQLIAQYEKGLKQDKEKHSNRVAETRGKRMKDFLLDEDVDIDGNNNTAENNEATPEVSTKSATTSVRALSQRFDSAALAAAGVGVSTPLRERESEKANEREGNTSRSASPFVSTAETPGSA